MRFLGLVLFLASTFWSSKAISQDNSSSIKFKLIDYKTLEAEPGITYVLFMGSDSITSSTTNLNGEFMMVLDLEFQTDFQLVPINMEHSDSKDIINFTTIHQPMDYVFEVTRASKVITFKGQVAYYQPNNTKKIEEFEVEQVVSIIEAHPETCIQFSQTILHSESLKTANKRKANFLKFLEENGVDMACVQFEEEPRFLKAFNEDQRSRIQGAIFSLDSKCN